MQNASDLEAPHKTVKKVFFLKKKLKKQEIKYEMTRKGFILLLQTSNLLIQLIT